MAGPEAQLAALPASAVPEAQLAALPDEVLRKLFAHLLPAALASVTSSSHEFRSLAFLDDLWERHSEDVGAQHSENEALRGRARYTKHMSLACRECRRVTPYTFILTKDRLCEPCERAHPKKYGLATRQQLLHERGLESLSRARVDAVFASLPSASIGGVVWFLRRQVMAAVAASSDGAEVERAVEPTCARADDDDEADETADEAADEGADDYPDGLGEAVVGEWESAAAEHTATRRPKNAAAAARKAESKNAQKEHKRRVKAEARAKREGGGSPATPRFHAAANSKPKRASARHHREGATPDAWERQWRQLEDLFGVGLAGLSGLVLVGAE